MDIMVGIDFGTTNTVISIFENNTAKPIVDGVFKTIPSKIGFNNAIYCGNYIPISCPNIIHSFKTSIGENIFFTLNVLGGFKDKEYENLVEDYMNKSQLKNHVHFRGWVNQDDAINFISNSNILVIPSFQETLPMVIAENMAAGKVVVSSAVGGIPEMIEDQKNGFLFNLSDSNSLYKILQSLYNNDQLVVQIGKKAKEFAIARYHCDEVAAKTISFYKKVLSN